MNKYYELLKILGEEKERMSNYKNRSYICQCDEWNIYCDDCMDKYWDNLYEEHYEELERSINHLTKEVNRYFMRMQRSIIDCTEENK